MKKSYVIILETIIILCLLLILFGKVFIKQKQSSLGMISMKTSSTMLVAKKGNCSNKANLLWIQACVDLSGEVDTRDSFLTQRNILLTDENNMSELRRLENKGTPIKTTSTDFLWTRAKVDLSSPELEREDFLPERTILFVQENKPMPRKNVAVIQTTDTDFLWTDVRVNTYGDSATRETFLSKRAELLKQEKKSS